jgi:hypothetical protein
VSAGESRREKLAAMAMRSLKASVEPNACRGGSPEAARKGGDTV